MSAFKVGDRVRYQPDHYGPGDFENGIVKEVRDGATDSVWVVFHCGGNWRRYMDYTSANTMVADLKHGWGEA